MPLGDIYELETTIATDWGNYPAADCLFDVNLATGDHAIQQSGGGPPGDQPGSVDAISYHRTRGESVYSTFNKALKWYNYASGHPQGGGAGTTDPEMITSDLFVMPNLPTQYEGFNIQVGPANSDNKFDVIDPSQSGNPNLPSICNTYLNGPGMSGSSGDIILGSGDEMPNNFGIGVPWAMMTDFYAYMNPNNGIGYCNTWNDTDFWWNQGQGSWLNAPTKTDKDPNDGIDDIKLKNVKLIRYGKIPYMLKSAKKQVFNTGDVIAENLCDPELYWRNISHLKFEFKHDTIPIFNTYIKDEGFEEVTKVQPTSFFRNIFLLERIIQLPPDLGPEGPTDPEDPIAEYPTTHFTYLEDNLGGFVVPGITHDVDFVPGLSDNYANSNLSVIESITDPLGKVTRIEFNPEAGVSARYGYQLRPHERYGLSLGGERDFKQAKGYAFQFYKTVDKVTVEDRNGTKEWDYTYSGISRNPEKYNSLITKFHL